MKAEACPVPRCEWGDDIIDVKWNLHSDYESLLTPHYTLKVFPRQFNPIIPAEDVAVYWWDTFNPHETPPRRSYHVYLCQDHHEIFLQCWQEEMAYDVWFMEKTDDYYARTDGPVRGDLVHRFRGRRQIKSYSTNGSPLATRPIGPPFRL